MCSHSFQRRKEVKSDDEVTVKDVPGGVFAVATCNLTKELQSEFFKEHGYLESWKNLVDWVKASPYKIACNQCLEKALDPDPVNEDHILDLYCPIEKKPGSSGSSRNTIMRMLHVL